MYQRHLLKITVPLIFLSLGTYWVCGVAYVWWHIPEAYAAWDAGTLLVRYMEKQGGKWPDGWSDLQQIHLAEPYLRLYWNSHEPDYFDRMRKLVAIDWAFDPISRSPPVPVTRVDGSPLVCLWSDPNEMIEYYLDQAESPASE